MLPQTIAATILVSGTLLTSTAFAETKVGAPADQMVSNDEIVKSNSVNLSPLGLLSGSYGLNYERLFKGYHGLLVEGNFSSASDGDVSSSSIGGTIGYRFHWRGKQDSGFAGLNVGYSAGTGEATVGDGASMETFDVDTTVASVTFNLGRRWAWDSGFNLTFRIGAGKGSYNASTDSDNPDGQEAVELVDEILAFLPVAFDGELSAGYVF